MKKAITLKRDVKQAKFQVEKEPAQAGHVEHFDLHDAAKSVNSSGVTSKGSAK